MRAGVRKDGRAFLTQSTPGSSTGMGCSQLSTGTGRCLQNGSRWVNRMNQWAERIDRINAERDQRWGGIEKRVDKLEHPLT